MFMHCVMQKVRKLLEKGREATTTAFPMHTGQCKESQTESVPGYYIILHVCTVLYLGAAVSDRTETWLKNVRSLTYHCHPSIYIYTCKIILLFYQISITVSSPHILPKVETNKSPR